ncbi:MAG TPA: hypothetical protein VNN22_19450 [Verrucomicrobiae bacterium]|nr:hypothetical protein [Verrucomicrobiae bacterium]
MIVRTKERLIQATALAKETLGDVALSQNPGIVSSILMSMALDDLSDSIKQENDKLTECIFRSAGHVAK